MDLTRMNLSLVVIPQQSHAQYYKHLLLYHLVINFSVIVLKDKKII